MLREFGNFLPKTKPKPQSIPPPLGKPPVHEPAFNNNNKN
jgi:hypothetical protein